MHSCWESILVEYNKYITHNQDIAHFFSWRLMGKNPRFVSETRLAELLVRVGVGVHGTTVDLTL
jgi:hypothetical protein